MIRLIYISLLAKPLSRDQFDSLCLAASEFNGKAGISGLLLSNGKEFMQCLEGPAKSVKALYQRILQDSRHTDIRLLFSSPVSNRIFEGWSMQGAHTSPLQGNADTDSVYQLLDHRLQKSWRSMGEGAVELIDQYARVKQSMEAGGPLASPTL